MILMNRIDKYKGEDKNHIKQLILNQAIESVVLLLLPFTPHLCEELWQKMGGKEKSIVHARWPMYDEQALKKDTIQVVVQINGKLRGKFDIASHGSEAEIKTIILADAKLKEFLQDKPIKRFIYIPGKLVNLVV